MRFLRFGPLLLLIFGVPSLPLLNAQSPLLDDFNPESMGDCFRSERKLFGVQSCRAGRIDLNRGAKQTQAMKKELIFEIEQEDGSFVAVCHEPEMATQGDTLGELVAMIRDLVKCRFNEGDEHLGWPIRLHFVRDPVLADAAA